MGSVVFPAVRAVVVVALTLSLGLGGVCPCESVAASTVAAEASHSATCSHCGPAHQGCHTSDSNCSGRCCGQQLPQQRSEPAAPPFEDDREPTIFHSVSPAIVVNAVADCDVFDIISASTSDHTLVAQRTRFNI